jgi:hypothetical protein
MPERLNPSRAFIIIFFRPPVVSVNSNSAFSRGFSVVVTQKATHSVATVDGAVHWKFAKIWADNLVFEALMVSLSMSRFVLGRG